MKCEFCGIREAVDKHEFFYGNGIREIAIEYELQINLCRFCHDLFHSNKKKYQKHVCKRLGIDYVCINKIMRKPQKYWDDINYRYMDNIRDHIRRVRGE